MLIFYYFVLKLLKNYKIKQQNSNKSIKNKLINNLIDIIVYDLINKFIILMNHS